MRTTSTQVIAARFCAVGQARREIVQLVKDLGITLETGEASTVEACLSELIANAVLHGCGGEAQDESAAITYGVRILPKAGRIRFWVADPGPGLPHPTKAGPNATSGRGLALVDSMSDGLGWQPGPIDEAPTSAKVVWFEIAASSLAPDGEGAVSRLEGETNAAEQLPQVLRLLTGLVAGHGPGRQSIRRRTAFGRRLGLTPALSQSAA
ncbi:ATP-binding protein [Kitasatospora sp. NPDC050543]|uniref:ATP-binding protein n=1 Tax=Kitasatospora sp. NPDC050543 TaxID=3364054 RepID=UPI0037A03C69